MLEGHIYHIKIALQKMRDAKFFARLHRCSFFQEKVEDLGFDVSRHGVQPSPEKVRTVVEWPQPQSVKHVHNLLALAEFYKMIHLQFQFEG